MSNKLADSIDNLYSERKRFIVIGLTGRTGSGCTTVASLLNQDFKNLKAPKPMTSKFDSNEDRKYNILYNFAKDNWKKFNIIQFRNLITTFILDESFDKFKEVVGNFLKKEYDLSEIEGQFDDVKDRWNSVVTMLKINDEIESIKNSEEDYSNFHMDLLPQFTDNIKGVLEKYDSHLFNKVYETISRNIRSSGNAYTGTFKPKNMFELVKRANILIKCIRKVNKEALVVIDAITNPYEATFFKDRYSAFYLFSIHMEDEERQKRLVNKGSLSISQIEEIDKRERAKDQKGLDRFTSKNIEKCIELSDVYLLNFDNETDSYLNLKKQIIKYVSLIMHPGLVTPTHVERCMQIANNARLNSGCLSRQVGAVVTDENYSIKSVGWNSTPESQVPCNLRNLQSLFDEEDREAFSIFELTDKPFKEHLEDSVKEKITEGNNLKGRLFPYCFKDAYNSYEGKENQVHTRSLHAEENAFLQISKYGGIGVNNGFLFTTASPCELCSKKAYQLGIKTIYYINPYPGISKKHILKSGKNDPKMQLFQGAIGRAYDQLYTSILPYKDELYMLLDCEFKKNNKLPPACNNNEGCSKSLNS